MTKECECPTCGTVNEPRPLRRGETSLAGYRTYKCENCLSVYTGRPNIKQASGALLKKREVRFD